MAWQADWSPWLGMTNQDAGVESEPVRRSTLVDGAPMMHSHLQSQQRIRGLVMTCILIFKVNSRLCRFPFVH